MERSLLLAATAAVACGLLRGMEARRLRSLGAEAAPGSEEAEIAARRSILAGASAEGLLTAGMGALGMGLVCRMAPGHPELPALLALGLSLAVLAAGVRARGNPARWPAVLAAELTGSFSAAAAAALVLAEQEETAGFVLGLAAAGLLASMAGIALASRAGRTGELRGALELGGWVSALLAAAAALPLSWLLEDGLPAFGAAACGLAAGLLTTRLAAGESLRRLGPPLALGGTTVAAWYLAGPLGVALAALGMTAPAAAWGVAADWTDLTLRTSGTGEKAGELPWVPGRELASVAALLSVLALLAACARLLGLDTAALFGPQLVTGLVVAALVSWRRPPRSTATALSACALIRLLCAAALIALLLRT